MALEVRVKGELFAGLLILAGLNAAFALGNLWLARSAWAGFDRAILRWYPGHAYARRLAELHAACVRDARICVFWCAALLGAALVVRAWL